MNKKKLILGSIILATVIIGAYGLFKDDRTINIEAETILAKIANVTTMVTAPGTIEPITQVQVGTQVSGVVEKVYVDYNSYVKQILV